MSKSRPPIYFQKRYCLLVHSLVINQQLRLAAFSNFSSEREVVTRSCSYTLNQSIYINCIDIVRDGVSSPDSKPALLISQLGLNQLTRSDLGKVIFQMEHQRIINPQSSMMFSKELEGGKGIIHYKFTNLKTRSLTQQEFQVNRKRKQDIASEVGQTQYSQKMREMMQFVKQKDKLVEQLQSKLDSFVQKKRAQNNLISKQNERQAENASKEKRLSLDVKINSVSQPVKRQNQRLKQVISKFEMQLEDYEQQIQNLNKQKQAFEYEIRVLKRNNQQLNALVNSFQGDSPRKIKVSRRDTINKVDTSSYLAADRRNSPPEMKSSTSINHYMKRTTLGNAPLTQSGKMIRKDTMGNPMMEQSGLFRRDTIGNNMIDQSRNGRRDTLSNQMADQGRLIRQDSIGNTLMVQPQIRVNMMGQSQMMLQSQMRLNMRQSQMNLGSHMADQVIQDPNGLQATDPNTIEARINLQKEEMFINNALTDKNQQIIILKKKLQVKNGEIKSLEKQIQRLRLNLKKKDAQILAKKKNSRMNLAVESMTKDIGSLRNKAEFQMQLDRVNADHQNEKLILAQQMQQLENIIAEKERQNKRSQNAVDELATRNKTLNDKHNQLKKMCQETAVALIEFKEKAQEYQKTVIKNQALQGQLRDTQFKLKIVQENHKTLETQNTKSVNKLRDMEKEWDTLKRLQREHQFLVRQNNNLRTSIETYDERYTQLKKYCVKIEAAYTKFVSARRKSDPASKKVEQQQAKEIESRLIELNKRMNDVQATFYKTQLQDLNGERSFVQAFFEEKLRDQRQKILKNNNMDQQQKDRMILAKEQDIRKGKEGRVDSIIMKISRLEKSFEDANLRNSSKGQQSFIMSMPQKMRILQRKFEMMAQREREWQTERKKLKESLSKTSQQLQHMRSSTHIHIKQPTGQGQTESRKFMFDPQRSLLLSTLQAQNAKKRTLLDQARQRNQASQQRNLQQHRRIATQYMKQNSELRQKSQKLISDLDKMERKANQRQKQMEVAFKKSEMEFKLKNDKLQEKTEKMQAQIDDLNQKLNDSQHAVATLTDELQHLSQNNQEKATTIHRLEDRIVEFEERIQEYERCERSMIEEVADIKRNSQLSQQELFRLVQNRSENFSKIVKVKQVEIEKLGRVIGELQAKLEEEMSQGMKLRVRTQQLTRELQEKQKAVDEKEEQHKMQLIAKDEQLDQLYFKELQATREKEALESNLMEISTDIQNKEMEIAELQVRLSSTQQQLSVANQQGEQFTNAETRLKEQNQRLKQIVQVRGSQLLQFEDKMRQFQLQVHYSSKEMERLTLASMKAQEDLQQLHYKHNIKQEQIIQLKQDNGMLQIQIKKHQYEYQQLNKEHQQVSSNVQRLEDQLAAVILKNEMVNRKQPESPGRSRLMRMDSKRPGLYQPNTPTKSRLNRMDSKRPGIALEIPGSNNQQQSATPGLSARRKISMNVDVTDMLSVKRPSALSSNSDGVELLPNSLLQVEKGAQQYQITGVEEGQQGIRLISGVNIDVPDQDQSLRTSYRQQGTLLEKSRFNQEEIEENQYQHLQTEENQGNAWMQQIDELKQQLQAKNQKIQEQAKQIDALGIALSMVKQTMEKLTLNAIMGSPADQAHNTSRSGSLSRKQTMLDGPGSANRLSRKNTLQPGFASRLNKKLTILQNVGDNQNNQLPVPVFDAQIQQFERSRRLADPQEAQNSIANYQVQIQGLQNQLHDVALELEQQRHNNQLLIQEAELCKQTIQQLKTQVDQLQAQRDHLMRFVPFEQMYQREVAKAKQLEKDIQQLNAQIFEKQGKISGLIGDSTQLAAQLQTQNGRCVVQNTQNAELMGQIANLQKTISKLKVEYRKYEEQSELEIMQLRQKIDEIGGKEKTKQADLLQLGNQYVQLQGNRDELLNIIALKEKQAQKQRRVTQEWQQKFNKVSEQLEQSQTLRKNLMAKQRGMQQDSMNVSDRMKEMVNQQVLIAKKQEIRVDGLKQEIAHLSERLTDKQGVIIALKGEISLYNDECEQLRRANDEMTYSLGKVQKQLKDIMEVYEKELADKVTKVETKENAVVSLTNQIKEKDKENSIVNRQLRMAEREIQDLKSETIDLRGSLDKLKQHGIKQTSDLFMKIEMGNSQLIKSKTQTERVLAQLKQRQETHEIQIKRHEIKMQGYKDKLKGYQSMLQQLSLQVQKMSSRPTNEQHDQIVFANDVLRGRVEELSQQLKVRGADKGKQEAVYAEFRKYKANKDRQIVDLDAEMEKYCLKINQLEQTVFVLKRENEELRQETVNSRDVQQEIRIENEDLKETLGQLQTELDFYKKRKIFDMQKLLNETN